MAEFLCRGYKCACGERVKLTQVQKPNALPTGSDNWAGAHVVCPRCQNGTFITRKDFVEWTEKETVQ